MNEIISNHYLIFFQGKKMFSRGDPCPSQPPDDETEITREVLLWCGYRVAMADEFEKRCSVAKSLGMPRPEWDQIFK